MKPTFMVPVNFLLHLTLEYFLLMMLPLQQFLTHHVFSILIICNIRFKLDFLLNKNVKLVAGYARLIISD